MGLKRRTKRHHNNTPIRVSRALKHQVVHVRARVHGRHTSRRPINIPCVLLLGRCTTSENLTGAQGEPPTSGASVRRRCL